MALVLARDGKVFLAANMEYLSPEEAYDLAAKVRAKALAAMNQRDRENRIGK